MDSLPSQSGRSESPFANSNRSSSFTSPLSKSLSDASSQSFSSILNNPKPSSSLVGWWSSSTSVPAPEFTPLPSVPKPGSEITRSDFLSYLSSVSEPHSRFQDILKQHDLDHQVLDGDSEGAAGEALVACLREVPALYFKEDFELEDGPTFRAACPFRTTLENLALQERLSQYLDVVELHLVREISLRSNSFFEAQGQLEDLNAKILEGCGRVRELKETIRILDSNLVGSARTVQELSLKRGDLISLHNKLRLVLSVNQALSTLELLVASADCVGALDITDDLQHLLDGDELTGLHCFRHLRNHVATSIDSINSILSAEFIRASLHGADDLEASLTRHSSAYNGRDNEVRLEEERISNFQDQLLPIIIGLLRTGKLPAVLRIYRDTLVSEIKTSVKLAVENMHLESDSVSGDGVVDADGGGSSLGTKLKSLSPDGFLKLLEEVFMIVQMRLMRASDVKKAIEWIMGNLSGHYAAASVAAAIALGAAAPETTQETYEQGNSILSQSSLGNDTRVSSIQGRGNDNTSPSNLSRNFRTDILRENAEALFAACDAAHGRWAKIVGIRSQIHPKLRLQDFLSVYNISQEFISSTEKIGGRLGYSIRGTLQSQAKAFIEFQHEFRMAKMKALLDQENWTEIDVPDEFQTIVTSLTSSDSMTDGHRDEAPGTYDNSETISSSNDFPEADAGLSNSSPHIELPDSNGMSAGHAQNAESSRLSGASGSGNTDVGTSGTSSTQSNNVNTRERGKSSLRMLYFKGVGYHMVNCGLYLVKMLSEYVDMNNCLPTLSAEVVHRVVEILKFFNSRTCHLVLGANALQVSGLKSITSKHLAMASQVISFTYAIIPEIRRVLSLKVPETYKGLLLLEIDRVANDYKVHRDEIHSKLVQIMRERLVVHLRGLPQIVESWNRSEDTDPQPSQFARSLTKEVGYLQRTLSKHLLEEDVQAIFGQVVVIFHSQISEAFKSLQINSPQANSRLYCDIQHILGCIRSLPSVNFGESGPPNWGQLDEFLVQNFGTEASE
ncbi:vacuolar protein sorting-associated protein 54, chloroplastic isoform X1 [Olea europaea var. sylvestris]|uniref:vacuolar protein sorting-associated protein 54, chloroplastic isoform X1 n=1 Tax=Olea europaea var. sylvestris TaxID=158386 RepID=UPI000C1D7B06|nr:vacuolar protein sorting-associated protein 54, chloroplastic isoform X1 [Olea europaea var. sylvestris]